jgi:predicted phage terminase large subunit-like protein
MSDAPARPSWDKPSWAYVRAPLPQPGPVRASERRKILRARRPPLSKNEAREFIKQNAWDLEKVKAVKNARLVQTSLAEFVKQSWAILEPGAELVWNWHLDVMCEYLEKVTSGEITRLLINVPPGHMKSLIVSVMWPAWVWLENPSWRSLYATYVEKLSQDFADKSRLLIKSEWYQSIQPKLYGPKWDQPWSLRHDSSAVGLFKNNLHGARFSTSLTASGTGFRGDVLVVDDPMNVEEFPTPEALQGVISWFDGRMGSRFNNMVEGRIVIIMQRLHENDLAGHVLAQDEREKNNPNWRPYTHLKFPAEYEPEKACPQDRRTKAGELLFPQRFPQSEQEIQKIKLGPYGYSAQHRQDPIPQGGGLFETWKIAFWYPAERDKDNRPAVHMEKDDTGALVACKQGPLPARMDVECQSWDCAFKDFDSSDYVAGHYYGRKGSSIYLLERVHARLSYRKTKDAIREMSKRHPRGFAKYIEDKANGTAVVEELSSEIFGVEAVNPEGGKIARANAASPLVSAGNIWFPHPEIYPWVKEVLAELRGFPVMKNDDDVDAFTQAVIKLALKHYARIKALSKS